MHTPPSTDVPRRRDDQPPSSPSGVAAAADEPSAVEHGRQGQWDFESPVDVEDESQPTSTKGDQSPKGSRIELPPGASKKEPGPSSRFDWLYDMSKLASNGDIALQKIKSQEHGKTEGSERKRHGRFE